jgi:hypothetical protein
MYTPAPNPLRNHQHYQSTLFVAPDKQRVLEKEDTIVTMMIGLLIYLDHRTAD